ncbi:MAG: Omp28-related outer membrane protein [Lewinellaceae bacterium]|nr:Omp28-related outer membrane protein [Lewinellaceae bacterium]
MKKRFLLSVFCCATVALFAQGLPKKYVLIEHFTNSNCSICASRNPTFYNLIGGYADDVRHLSIHPPVPYSSCKFYQANTSENSARTNLYGISGTPRVALNGTLAPVSSQLLPQATLEAQLNQESPIAIEVTEGGNAPNKTITVTVTTYGTVPAGSYKLFAAVAESTVNYNAPNGESKHHDVFHAMLPGIDGQNITLPAVGNSASFNFNFTHTAPSGWTSNFDSLYVLAFVQNAGTKEILNTGTRFDPQFVGTGEAAAKPQAIRIQPNPVQDEAAVFLPNETIERVDVFSINGSLNYTSRVQQHEQVRIPTGNLTPGIYLVKLLGENGLYVGKMVKE